MASDRFQVVVPPDRSKPVSILIVEDEALVASYIEEVLGESGHGAQDGHGLRPLVGDDRGYRITVARALDRRCE